MFRFYKNRPLIERVGERPKIGDLVVLLKDGYIYSPAELVKIYKKSRRKYMAVLLLSHVSNKKIECNYFNLVKTRKDNLVEYFIKRPIWNLIKPRKK